MTSSDAPSDTSPLGSAQPLARMRMLLADVEEGVPAICDSPLFASYEFAVDFKLVVERAALADELLVALKAIADESVFNQQRFAEDEDADYFLRCFKALKERARSAIAKASPSPGGG